MEKYPIYRKHQKQPATYRIELAYFVIMATFTFTRHVHMQFSGFQYILQNNQIQVIPGFWVANTPWCNNIRKKLC